MTGGRGIEATISAVGQACDVLEGLFDQTISTLLEQEGGHAETARALAVLRTISGLSPKASPTNTSALTLSSLVSLLAWVRTFSIWVSPARHMIDDMILAS